MGVRYTGDPVAHVASRGGARGLGRHLGPTGGRCGVLHQRCCRSFQDLTQPERQGIRDSRPHSRAQAVVIDHPQFLANFLAGDAAGHTAEEGGHALARAQKCRGGPGGDHGDRGCDGDHNQRGQAIALRWCWWRDIGRARTSRPRRLRRVIRLERTRIVLARLHLRHFEHLSGEQIRIADCVRVGEDVPQIRVGRCFSASVLA